MIDIGSSVVRETFVLPPLGCLISFGRRGRSALFGATLVLGRYVSMSSVCVPPTHLRVFAQPGLPALSLCSAGYHSRRR